FPVHGSGVSLCESHRHAGGGKEALDVTHRGRAGVEDAGGEGGVRAGVEGIAEVFGRAGATAGDDGDGHAASDRGGELEVVAAAASVLVDAGEQDLTGAALGALASPCNGIERCGGAAAVGEDGEAPVPGVGGIDARHHALAAEPLGGLGEQLGPADGGGVDADLVGAGAEDARDVVHAADAAADGERNEQALGGAQHDVQQGGAALDGGGDVEEHDLVRALGFVAHGELDGVAHVAQVHEAGALHDAAVTHVQAHAHALAQHHTSVVRWSPPARDAAVSGGAPRSADRSMRIAPLVLNTASPGASAWRSARPNALNAASTMWWRSRPRSTRRWSVMSALSASERKKWS